MLTKRTWAMLVGVVVVAATLVALAYMPVVRGKSQQALTVAFALTGEMDITATADLGGNHDERQSDEWVVLPSSSDNDPDPSVPSESGALATHEEKVAPAASVTP
jgi:hypothetical protein